MTAKTSADDTNSLPFELSAYNTLNPNEEVESATNNRRRTSLMKNRQFIFSLVSILSIASGTAIVIVQKKSASPDVNKTSMVEPDRLLVEPTTFVSDSAKKEIDPNEVVAYDTSVSMSMDFSTLTFSMPLPTMPLSMPLDSLSMSMFSLSPEVNSFGTGSKRNGAVDSKGKKKGPKYPKSVKSPKPTITYNFCDKDALPAELTRLSSLENDRFYKLCPGLQQIDGAIIPLGQPRCGDNSNYSFFLTRPTDGKKDKVIIELSGGGACWDIPTCTAQAPFLTFPTMLNAYVGSSCASSPDLLCSKTIGDVDLSEYNFMFIPYCTQDVHLGDASISSTFNDYGVQHVGGHNLYRTLAWVFENFPNPKHVFLTGCSAGATVLPVVYDMINMHYERKRRKGHAGVTIDVIADSSVFLTPSYFIENGLPHWNIGTITRMIDFDFDASTEKTEFSVDLLNHVLQRSKDTDDVGYSYHDDDKISQYYYMLMSGIAVSELLDSDGESPVSSMFESGDLLNPWVIPNNNTHRSLNVPDLQPLWWAELTSSLARAGNGRSNFQVFYMQGPEHCTYGLNIALPYEGFEVWASNILQFDTVNRERVFRRRG